MSVTMAKRGWGRVAFGDAVARVPQVIARLKHRRAVIALAVLRCVEPGADVLILAHDLGNARAIAAELADRQIGLAAMAALAGAGDREFGPELKAGSALAVRAVAPGI